MALQWWEPCQRGLGISGGELTTHMKSQKKTTQRLKPEANIQRAPLTTTGLN